MPFEPGQSGNPTGRPKKSNKAAGMAREHTDKAIAVLVDKLASEKDDVQIKAAVELLNRGWGKPTEFHEITGEDGEPILHKMTVELVRAKNTDT